TRTQQSPGAAGAGKPDLPRCQLGHDPACPAARWCAVDPGSARGEEADAARTGRPAAGARYNPEEPHRWCGTAQWNDGCPNACDEAAPDARRLAGEPRHGEPGGAQADAPRPRY